MVVYEETATCPWFSSVPETARPVLEPTSIWPWLTTVPLIVRPPPVPSVTWMVPSAALVRVPLPVASVSA